MAISFVGSLPPVGANNGGNVTLSFSNLVNSAGGAATLQQGDIVVCAYACSGTADHAMSTSSAGWNEISPEVYANGTIDTNLAVYWKIMGASPDTSFVAVGPGGTSNGTIAVAFAFRGAHATTPFSIAATTATGTGTSVPNPASITPTTAGSWPICIRAGVAGTGAAFTVPADLSSTTNHFRSANHAETNDVAIGLGFKTNWASGAFDCAAFGGGNVNASNSWGAISLVLEPAAAVNHSATGALTGQIGGVAGTARHNVPHAATGALQGQGTTLAGSAARTRVHAATGALAGPGAALAGSANRSVAVTHAAAGELVGAGAILAAASARFRAFAATGALIGAGALLVASAARGVVEACRPHRRSRKRR